MENKEKQLEALAGIKELMERSSRFVSFSGISLISAGIVAIAGTVIATIYLDKGLFDPAKSVMPEIANVNVDHGNIFFLVITSLIVFAVALIAAFVFFFRKAKSQNLVFWDNIAKRVFLNHFIFFFTGGMFCLILLYYGIYFLIVPAMLIFYGLALVNVSKFTMNEIAQLGIFEILLGIIASFVTAYPLLMWMLGFGILHMVYGSYIYFKYERTKLL